jgi:hypothetical protein
MRVALGFAFALIPLAPPFTHASEAGLPVPAHYTLEYRLLPAQSRLEARAAITLHNPSPEPLHEVPLLLYRLLDVSAVTTADGAPLAFRQSVERMQDNERQQVNFIRVALPAPLAAGARTTVVVSYAGPVLGAAEVWPYVHDRVGEPVSLLRRDVYAYPVPARPDRRAGLETFTFDVDVTLPRGLVAAVGGVPTGTKEADDVVTFSFRSTMPTWRIDAAAGRYRLLEDALSGMRVYHLGDDDAGALAVLHGMRDATQVYTRLFGPAPRGSGFTAIEIPDGWGSQAGDGWVLQTAAAFRDAAHIHELYHEIAHSWNVRADPTIQQTRWFDEAFASYFEALALRELNGRAAFERRLDAYRQHFARRAAADTRVADTPIADYGAARLGANSYTKGAWSLYVLHEAVGEAAFRAIIRRFLAEHAERPAGFADFQRVVHEVTGDQHETFFREWIHGTASSRLLMDDLTVQEMARRCGGGSW